MSIPEIHRHFASGGQPSEVKDRLEAKLGDEAVQ